LLGFWSGGEAEQHSGYIALRQYRLKPRPK
jgi:hypothetical protein